MKIGDEVYTHGYVDEIRKDTIIIRNDGGYFGTVESEIFIKPIRHGHWKINYLDDTKVNQRYAHIICSECKADIAHDWEGKSLLKTTLNYNYCPNCGARMDGEV